MARRKKKEQEKKEGAPAWMVTYSDMVTLLLTFFVMLVAMASFEDVQRVARDLFLPGSLSATVLGPVDGRPASEAQLGLQ